MTIPSSRRRSADPRPASSEGPRPSSADRRLAGIVLEHRDLDRLQIDDSDRALVDSTLRQLDTSERRVIELGQHPEGLMQLRRAAQHLLARRLARARLQRPVT